MCLAGTVRHAVDHVDEVRPSGFIEPMRPARCTAVDVAIEVVHDHQIIGSDLRQQSSGSVELRHDRGRRLPIGNSAEQAATWDVKVTCLELSPQGGGNGG